ncbi:MAG: hypothetical protein ACSLFO_10800 [Acidimicrobiales bacterium]
MHRHGDALCVGLAVVTTATTFVPWGASGDKVRSSYAIVDIAERGGVLSAAASSLSVLWYFVPVLCGVVLISAAVRTVVITGVAATTLGALVAIGGMLVVRSPLVTEPGAVIGASAGVCTVLAGVATLTTNSMRRNDERPVGPER